MPLSLRRGFLKGSASVAGLSFAGKLAALQTRNASAASGSSATVGSPYGRLAPVLDLATGLPLLRLPEGFNYRSFGWTGDPMADRQPCPGSADGMAVLASPRGPGDDEDDDDAEDDDDRDDERRGPVDVVLVRNHERGLSTSPIRTHVLHDTAPDNSGATQRFPGGGTTHLVFRGRLDQHGSKPRRHARQLRGRADTMGQLAHLRRDEHRPERGGRPQARLCVRGAASARATTGRPLRAMGRFSHEAVAVDPKTSHAHLTEDSRNRSGLHRFIPHDRRARARSYEAGGRSQMAKVVGASSADLIVASTGRRELRVRTQQRGARCGPDRRGRQAGRAGGLPRAQVLRCLLRAGGKVRFVNVQSPGITFAIWGPWKRGPL